MYELECIACEMLLIITVFVNVVMICQDQDPFWEPPDMEVIIGIASLPLKFLAYMIEFKDEDQLNVMDYSAQHCGYLQVQLIPCDSKGSEDVDLAVERPEDLVHIVIIINLTAVLVQFMVIKLICLLSSI